MNLLDISGGSWRIMLTYPVRLSGEGPHSSDARPVVGCADPQFARHPLHIAPPWEDSLRVSEA